MQGALREASALTRAEPRIPDAREIPAEGARQGLQRDQSANFNAPNTNLNSANFGRITSAGPRIFQFALKLHF
jgi:hypothetical protein